MFECGKWDKGFKTLFSESRILLIIHNSNLRGATFSFGMSSVYNLLTRIQKLVIDHVNILKKADINDKFSPNDILLKFRKVKNVDFTEKNIVTEAPKEGRELDKALRFNIFPTKNEN